MPDRCKFSNIKLNFKVVNNLRDSSTVVSKMNFNVSVSLFRYSKSYNLVFAIVEIDIFT